MPIFNFSDKVPSEEKITKGWISEDVKVTICCVVFNHGKFLERAIDSFLIQKTNFAFEILIHDDASTDNSKDIILKYANLYPKIIKPIIQKENIYSKKGKPLDVIFNIAKGEYFALCEGDDYWVDKDKLQIQYNYMVNNPKISITFHRSILVKNDIETNELALPGKMYKNYSSSELLSGRSAISTQSVMMTNKVKRLPTEYFNVMNEDSFLFVLAGEFGDGVYLNNIEPAAYRIHDGGIWSKRGDIYRKVRMAESYYWIAQYLQKKECNHYANIFRIKAAKILIYERGSSLFSLLVSAFKHIIIR